MPTDLGLRLAIHNSNLKAARSNPRLSPETGKPISTLTKSRYAVGFLVFGLLWMSVLGIGIAMPWLMPSATGMLLYAGIAGLGYGVYSSVDQALNVDVLPNKEEVGKNLGILNLATTLGQMLGPVLMSAITLSLGYAFAFPIAIAFALLGCVFIMLIRGVRGRRRPATEHPDGAWRRPVRQQKESDDD